MPCLSEHKWCGAIGMLKAGMRVLALPDILIAICQLYSASRDRYQATGTVNDQRRSSQPRIMTGVKTATYVDCVSTIFTSTISVQAGYCQCQTSGRAPWVRTSDGGNGNHSVSLPIILIKIKVDQMLPSSYINSLLVSIS